MKKEYEQTLYFNATLKTYKKNKLYKLLLQYFESLNSRKSQLALALVFAFAFAFALALALALLFALETLFFFL